MQWYRVDLHIHTPASADYLDSQVNFIDILRKAERRGIDMLAFTDHNTVNGYAAMYAEIDRLQFLEQTGRALADELRTLAEYRRLLDKVLVLPGFEFTATFGFHILGIFSPETPLRVLEHLLLSLNVPAEVLDRGDGAVGSTTDVLTAYQMIDEAGGLVIAAHANTTHGVAMRGLDFGGQTRIAYTQDRHLHAIELTDLNRKGRGATRRLFDGTKAEYPRRMHVIQGSDAHTLDTVNESSGKNPNTRFGVGERVTEVLLPDRSFQALVDVFQSTDFSRTRPYNPNRQQPYDPVLAAREDGASLVQSFHETMDRKGGKLHNIIADVCAFANTNGGTVYVGIDANKKSIPNGVQDVSTTIATLQKEISSLISPTLDVEIDAQETQGKSVIRILVPYGEDRPYAINDNKIYVRDEAETSLAVRDEIVSLVQQGMAFRQQRSRNGSQTDESAISTMSNLNTINSGDDHALAEPEHPIQAVSEPVQQELREPKGPPRSGVEIVGVETRSETRYYIMHDLRNGNVVKNVTRSSARRLWDYAIKQLEGNPVKLERVQWQGNIGLWKRYQKGNQTRYDLVERAENGKLRVYYGVTESGMHGHWETFLEPEEG